MVSSAHSSLGRNEWQCAHCRESLSRPIEICQSCKNPTAIPSNIILAAEDEAYLQKRWNACRDSCSPDCDWATIVRYADVVQHNLEVSINMHPHTFLSLL